MEDVQKELALNFEKYMRKDIDETEYLLSSEKMEEVILQEMEDEKNGNYKEINIDEL